MIICLIHNKSITVKFNFACVNHVIIPLDQQIDLGVFFLIAQKPRGLQ